MRHLIAIMNNNNSIIDNEMRNFFSRIKRLTLNRENFVPRKFPNIRYKLN